MALTNAEKVRLHRERQKARKQEDLKKPSSQSDLFQKPFYEFFPVDEQVGSSFAQSLELCGISPPLIEDDSGPEAVTLDTLESPSEEGGHSNPFRSSKGTSLGRAEVTVGCLIEAARDLAIQIRDYKKSEIEARIGEIEASDLSDPDARKRAFEEAARLRKLLDEFDKQLRLSFPTWKA
ncbi:hypothetical protein [Thioclava sp. F36-6]|uniref:hypothetical protein n=1 Tax=Thioclava sp. F36-6 TaxID=1915316 RepID=UPI0009975C48|nr:hypothetical protein [Thioclava sp. F36-6]OOY31264.1 hypothetical protein BMI88_09085 [Thioclava sp. F36-6]